MNSLISSRYPVTANVLYIFGAPIPPGSVSPQTLVLSICIQPEFSNQTVWLIIPPELLFGRIKTYVFGGPYLLLSYLNSEIKINLPVVSPLLS